MKMGRGTAGGDDNLVRMHADGIGILVIAADGLAEFDQPEAVGVMV